MSISSASSAACPVIVIVGTNASGKSNLAVSLAQRHNGEIISADSRQVYRGLDIATGKISQKEMRHVPHHCIDIADPGSRYTAADFARDGRRVLADILRRDRLPIIVGGTGFYIDALLKPELLSTVPPNEELRAGFHSLPIDVLFSQLEKMDPERAQDLQRKGEHRLRRRVTRALEIALAPEAHGHVEPSPLPEIHTMWIGIHWDNDTLKERIRQRTRARLKEGMVEEAKRLHADGLSWERMEELGLEYKHLADFLRGYCSEEEMLERIERDDWKYAKRQRTWFKRNAAIKWFEGDNLGGVETLVQDFLSQGFAG